MAENQIESPVVNVQADNGDGSDNESGNENETQNPLDLSRFESDIKEQMTSMATQVKDSILSLKDHMHLKFQDFDSHVKRIETQVSDLAASHSRMCMLAQSNENTNNVQNCEVLTGQSSQSISKSSSNPITNQITDSQSQDTNSNENSVPNVNLQSKGDNFIKLKPQTYSGTDDFEDFLTQFDITSEINGWDYKAKSLYLANSLTGAARSLLNELTDDLRRDYKSLVQKLTARFGSENRAEVFRAQLKSRVKGKGETIPELAQAIKKLTRQSYPKATLDVIETLALDHFIDALTESEIRLRLREVGPKSLSEAETIAVRMEAHRIADKQHSRLVGKVEQETGESLNNQKLLSDITKNLDSLQCHVETLAQHKQFPPRSNPNYNRQYPAPNNNNFRAQNRFAPRRNSGNQGRGNVRFNLQPRGDNPNQNRIGQNNQQANFGRDQRNRQGNVNQSNQGSGFRLN